MKRDEALNTLNMLLKHLKIKIGVASCVQEGSFLIFDLKINPGGTLKKLEKYTTEIALSLKSLSEPLIYPITDKGIVRMEVMTSILDTVSFKEMIESDSFKHSDCILPLAIGQLRNGNSLIIDLTKMPHLLISGATGSGKSILLQTIINSLLVKGEDYSLALVDTKRVEFSFYNGISKLYGPVARDVISSIELLDELISEMEGRFVKLEKSGCRDISKYKKRMPYIILIIDELADLMLSSKKDVQERLCKLAQKSRACGIHIVAATQRPSVDVITGLIKANFPARISCQVSAAVDSRIILDRNGAEKLSGKGDAIIDCQGYRFKRFKGSYISEDEIISNVRRLKPWWSTMWGS
jgi:S-DNA-T family DNA segregation ATPase FtsK/SpoIIIE